MKRAMASCIFLLLIYPLCYFAFSQGSDLPSLNGYRRDVQKIFAEEVSSKKNIAQVSQTARLLAIMEFMEPSGYSGFFDCLRKYPSWEDLNATKREQVVDACGRVARSAFTKSVGPAPASAIAQGTTPGVTSSVDIKLTEILNRLKDIESRVATLQEQQRTIQENILSNRERATPRKPAASETVSTEEEITE